MNTKVPFKATNLDMYLMYLNSKFNYKQAFARVRSCIILVRLIILIVVTGGNQSHRILICRLRTKILLFVVFAQYMFPFQLLNVMKNLLNIAVHYFSFFFFFNIYVYSNQLAEPQRYNSHSSGSISLQPESLMQPSPTLTKSSETFLSIQLGGGRSPPLISSPLHSDPQWCIKLHSSSNNKK